MAMFLY